MYGSTSSGGCAATFPLRGRWIGRKAKTDEVSHAKGYFKMKKNADRVVSVLFCHIANASPSASDHRQMRSGARPKRARQASA